MEFLTQIYENKLLFYAILFVITFTIFFIIMLFKNRKDEKCEKIDYEKIDGDNSLFDQILNQDEGVKMTSDGKLDLESMIERMQKDLDAKASEVVEKFENEQEEKSVISYQELVGNKEDNVLEIDENKELSKEVEIDNLLTNIESNDLLSSIENSNISIGDNINIDDTISNDREDENLHISQKEDFVNAIKNGDFDETYDIKEKSKFKATEFVSPIYGVQDIKIQYPTVQNMKEFKTPAKNYDKFELEQTLNMEPLSDEIRKNEDFLNALKEFRKNLE